MKEIAVISGKGGTGKTSLTASLAALSHDFVLADCDVEAPDLHMLVASQIQNSTPFSGSKLASITQELCTHCAKCIAACRFDAIETAPSSDGSEAVLQIDPVHCEGCGVCAAVCPTGAITMHPRTTGTRYSASTRFGAMVYAQLEIGQGNSGKLVTAIRQDARKVAETQHKSWILIDGPPGIGCPVIAAIGGVDLALIVIEPTVSGVHDFERVMTLIEHFKITAAVCINRYDLNEEHTQAIVEHATDHNVSVIGKIPSDDAVTAAQMEGVSLIEYAPESPATDAVRHAHAKLERYLQEKA